MTPLQMTHHCSAITSSLTCFLAAVVIFGCSEVDDGTPASNDGGSTAWQPEDEDQRAADLTDSDIEQICANVRRQIDLECGTDPESGEPIIIDETAGRRDCIAGIERLRDDDVSNCRLARDVAECWEKDPCERRESDACSATCPEYEACWTYSTDECETAGAGYCVLRSGDRYDAGRDCFVNADAYCSPDHLGCDGAFTTARDPDDNCWLFNAGCAMPDDWSSDRDRTCPYLDDVEDCP